jgi:hypothetical protein
MPVGSVLPAHPAMRRRLLRLRLPETDLVKRLKASRKENGLSQRQAADVMVRSRGTGNGADLAELGDRDRRPVPMAAKLLETFLASVPKVKEKDRPKPYPKVASYRSEEDVGGSGNCGRKARR